MRKTTTGDGGEILKYYSVKQASEILQVTEETIRIWIRGKRLGASKIGRDYRISQEDIDEFMRKGRNIPGEGEDESKEE